MNKWNCHPVDGLHDGQWAHDPRRVDRSESDPSFKREKMTKLMRSVVEFRLGFERKGLKVATMSEIIHFFNERKKPSIYFGRIRTTSVKGAPLTMSMK